MRCDDPRCEVCDRLRLGDRQDHDFCDSLRLFEQPYLEFCNRLRLCDRTLSFGRLSSSTTIPPYIARVFAASSLSLPPAIVKVFDVPINAGHLLAFFACNFIRQRSTHCRAEG